MLDNNRSKGNPTATDKSILVEDTQNQPILLSVEALSLEDCNGISAGSTANEDGEADAQLTTSPASAQMKTHAPSPPPLSSAPPPPSSSSSSSSPSSSGTVSSPPPPSPPSPQATFRLGTLSPELTAMVVEEIVGEALAADSARAAVPWRLAYESLYEVNAAFRRELILLQARFYRRFAFEQLQAGAPWPSIALRYHRAFKPDLIVARRRRL